MSFSSTVQEGTIKQPSSVSSERGVGGGKAWRALVLSHYQRRYSVSTVQQSYSTKPLSKPVEVNVGVERRLKGRSLFLSRTLWPFSYGLIGMNLGSGYNLLIADWGIKLVQ